MVVIFRPPPPLCTFISRPKCTCAIRRYPPLCIFSGGRSTISPRLINEKGKNPPEQSLASLAGRLAASPPIAMLSFLERLNQQEGIAQKMPKCTGNTQLADEKFEELRRWLARYMQDNQGKAKAHTYVLANRHVYCTSCHVFTAETPRHINHVLCKPTCGDLGMPWGRICRQ